MSDTDERILTEEERAIREKLIESLSGVQLTSLLVEMYGIKHTLTLIGWVIRWGVAGFDNGPEFRAYLKSQGISRATAYRAALDWRRFGDKVEERYGARVSDDVLTQRVKESELAEHYLTDLRRPVL